MSTDVGGILPDIFGRAVSLAAGDYLKGKVLTETWVAIPDADFAKSAELAFALDDELTRLRSDLAASNERWQISYDGLEAELAATKAVVEAAKGFLAARKREHAREDLYPDSANISARDQAILLRVEAEATLFAALAALEEGK